MKLTAIGCGTILCDLGLLFEGEPSRESEHIPVTAFLVSHPDGMLLWDTGMNRAVRDAPLDHWGGVAKRLLVPHLGEGQDVVERLGAMGIEPSDVDIVVNSHLHNDHCGMNSYFPDARVLIRERELAHAVERMDTPSSGFVRADFYTEPDSIEVFDYDDSYDVFGDGTVKLISTAGHTPGHQCLQVTFASGASYVLTGDAAYNHDQICSCQASGISWSKDEMVRSLERLRGLEEAGSTILVAHDRARWSDLDGPRVIHEEVVA